MFGTRLKKLREGRELTQQQLADILMVGRPTIAGYEVKGKQPDFEKVVALATFFDVSTDYLLGRTDDPTPSHLRMGVEARGYKFGAQGKMGAKTLGTLREDSESKAFGAPPISKFDKSQVGSGFAGFISVDSTPVDQDAEIWKIREMLHKRPVLKPLLHASQKVTTDDLEKVVSIVDALALKKDEWTE